MPRAAAQPEPVRPRLVNKEPFAARVRRSLVGQDHAIDAILPYFDLHRARLSPDNRPAGVFLMLGATGTGKTHTVEVLARELHGSERNVLRIDCGEFQLDHEVAKLVGAPPGYLGHRETAPILTQQKVNSVTSDKSDTALVLFDEVEKAAPSMHRIMLGMLDRAIIKLGDNTTVNFKDSMIFMTSNLGARQISDALSQRFGFGTEVDTPISQIEKIGAAAARKKFSPEFMNRVDKVLVYHPLGEYEIEQILSLQLDALQRLVDERYREDGFMLYVTTEAREWIMQRGFSKQYGARELKRVLHQHILVPIAQAMLHGDIPCGGVVRFYREGDGLQLVASKKEPA